MRPNVISEASLTTRVSQWWVAVPFVTASILVLCGAIYILSLLVGYDSFEQVCFLPTAITSHYEVYRIFSSTLFHVSILHLVFNMLAFVPIGSGLERTLGSVRFMHVLLLIATSNGLLHLLIALLAAKNPFHSYSSFMMECSIGFSGVIFATIVMETSLSGMQTRSIFGLFNVPAKWYAWILLILFQLLMPGVSLLGHLCGILSGFAYTYGLFNPLLFGSSTYSAVESSWLLASCVRRPGFIVGGGMPSASLPTISHTSSAGFGDVWRRLRSLAPQRDIPVDERFPGRGRTLASGVVNTNGPNEPVAGGLQARLLDRDVQSEVEPPARPDSRTIQSGPPSQVAASQQNIDLVSSLVAMGFEQDKAEVALNVANGDLAMAVEILSGQV